MAVSDPYTPAGGYSPDSVSESDVIRKAESTTAEMVRILFMSKKI